MKRTYTIKDEAGLHARPASIMANQATKYSNDIFISYGDKRITLKSIMLVMSLGVPSGAEISIEVEGENPEEVFASLEKVMNDHELL